MAARSYGRVGNSKTPERLTRWTVASIAAVALLLTTLSTKNVDAKPNKVLASKRTPNLTACIATQFAHKGDKWAGEKFFCTRRKVSHRQFGIAHRTLPCGTMVLITNIRTGRSVRAPVIDRGPYWVVPTKCSRDNSGFPSHKCWAKGRAKVRRYLNPASGITFASCADLTPPVARAIGLNGKEPVIVYVLPKKKKRKRRRYRRRVRSRRNW